MLFLYVFSEKQRVPAWTDRIIFKGPRLQQLQYTRTELYTSDHRPVLALFEAEVCLLSSLKFVASNTDSSIPQVIVLDHDAEAKMKNELYQEKLQSGVVSKVEVNYDKTNRKPPLPTTPRPVVNKHISTPPAVDDILIDVDEIESDDDDDRCEYMTIIEG
jgi:hypothetical protein